MKIQSAKAGIGTGRAGLQAASGLFSNAGLFDKGVKSFHPNDLDPYLLFDAESSMIGTLENPTLDLDPSKQDTLDVITATRAGVATYTDINGLIASAPANTVRVDYTQGAELTPTKFQHIGYTDFSQGWTLQAGITLNVNTTETLSPEGQNNAAKVVSTDNTKGFFFGGLSLTVAAIRTIFLKGEAGGETITFKDPSGHGTPIVHTLTTEWVRYEISTTNDGNTYQGLFIDNISVGTIYVYGPQFEEGTTASDFVENTTGSPKFITGATYGPRVPMILVEPSATNLIPYSEDFSQSAWSKNNVTLSSGFSAPDGSMNASKLIANAADSSLQNTFTVASGTTYSVSFYLKTISGSLETAIALGSPGFPQNEGEGGRYKNITVTDEWQRFTLTSTADANAATGISFGGFSSFSTGEEVYIWGAQLETGIATSLIPTSGSTAQRAADDLVISGSDFTDFYNQTEFTLYLEAQKRDAGSVYNFTIGNGTLANRIAATHNSIFVTQGGTGNTATSITLPNNQLYRLAASFKSGNSKVSVDGGSEAAVASSTLPTSTGITLGGRQDDSNAQKLNGHIKRLIYWPYHSDSL